MIHARSFTHEPESVASARRFAVQALAGLPDTTVENVELMVSEVATNCVRHTNSAFEIAITVTGEEVGVAVTDRADGTPTVRSPAPTDPHGRGLLIIDMLAGAWGVEPRSGVGKTVWFTIPTPPDAAVHSAADRVDRSSQTTGSAHQPCA